MQLNQTFRTAMQALGRNKIRTFLTMLGVIIGVFAVVALVSAVKGFENYVGDQFDAIGSNTMYIMPGKMSFNSDPYKALAANKFQPKHPKIIEKYAGDYVSHVTGYYRLAKDAKHKSNTYTVFIEGSNEDTEVIYDLELLSGRFYTKTEVANKNRVVVLADKIAEELFTNRNPIGEQIKIEGNAYDVIGVFEVEITDFRNSVFIPETVVKDDFDMKRMQGLALKFKSEYDSSEVSVAVKVALLHDLKADEFTVFSQTDMMDAFKNILNVIGTGLAAVAGISLLVGGIGIMNIMLVSVTERTREIGLRKALGATSRNIGQQFVFEAISISLSGGLIGLLLAWGLTLSVQSIVRAEVPLWSIFMALGFSIVVGLVFGTYPAVKASKKDPIEALRFE
jgi:putative ABC transport system permease protein